MSGMTAIRVAEAALNFVLRIPLRCAERIRCGFRLIFRPELFGVHAIPFTPDGSLILVKLRYVAGWHLPGGGVKIGESPSSAVLRELREEIGLCSHLKIDLIRETAEMNAFRRGHESVYLVSGVIYQPRWCLEVEAVKDFDLASLPSDVSPWTRGAIDALIFRS